MGSEMCIRDSLHVSVVYHGRAGCCVRYMEFDEILRGHGQRVPIKEAEIQKYAKKVAALYKEKIALLPDHVKSSMSIGAVVVDIGKHNTARDTFEQV